MAAVAPTYTIQVDIGGTGYRTIAVGTTLSVPISNTDNLTVRVSSNSPTAMSGNLFVGTATSAALTINGSAGANLYWTHHAVAANTYNWKISQPASGTTYTATSNSLLFTSVAATAPTLTLNANNGSSVTAPAGNTVNMGVISNSAGAITYSLASGAPSGSSINSTTGLVTLGNGIGTYTVQVTQAKTGSYSELYLVSGGTFTAVQVPNITAAATQSITYSVGATATVIPSSQNPSGAFTYSLADGAPTGSSVNSSGVVTIGGAGTITVLVTQAASTGWAAVTTAKTAGVINVNAINPIGTASTQSVVYSSGATVKCAVTSANTATDLIYSLGSGSPVGTTVIASGTGAGTVTVGGVGTITVLVSQSASGGYLAVTNAIASTITVTPAPTLITLKNDSISCNAATYTAVPQTNNSTGAFFYSFGGAPPVGTSINPSSGIVTLAGSGVVQIFITQAAGGNYAAITTPTEAIRLTVTAGIPALSGLGDKTFAWNGLNASMAVGSPSKGAFTYTIANTPTPPAGTTINANTGVITPGGTGSLKVYVTQAADGKYSAITTPQLVGTLTITTGFPVITQAPLSTIIYSPGEQVQVVAQSTNTETPLVYSIISGTNGTCDASGNVTITGPGTLTIGVTQAASGYFNAITTAINAGVIVVQSATSTTGKSFISPTYIGANRLYVLPEDNLSVQPSRLACLTRKYACPKPYAAQARSILSVGSNPYTGDGSSSATSWPSMWLFRKPDENTDGVITTFTCQYYGVRDISDFNVIYQVIGSEIKAIQGNATFIAKDASIPATGLPFNAKYVSPLITQTYVQKTFDAMQITTPALPYTQASLFEVMVIDFNGYPSPLNALTAALSPYGTITLWNQQYPLYPSFISMDQTNYGVVTETTLKFGAVLSTNQF